MTPENLVALKQRLLDAQDAYTLVGITNTYGRTAKELVRIDLAFRKAEMDLRHAMTAYENAVKTEIGALPRTGVNAS